MNNKKKITTISFFDINHKNGGAIFAKNMDCFLNGTDEFISEVYCNKRNSIHEEQTSSNKVQKSFLKSKVIQIIYFFKKSTTFELFVHFLRNDLNAIILVFKLFFSNKVEKESILLFHDGISLFYFSLFFSLKKRKVVLIMHNNGSPVEMATSGIKNEFKRKILAKIVNSQINASIIKVNKVVFLCDSSKFNFIKLHKIKIEQTITIPNGIKSLPVNNLNKKTDDRIEFITVCTMNERKGIDILIDVLPIINQNFGSKINFTILGQGPLLNDLRDLSTHYNNINVVGESSLVTNYLEQSDVFFLLSRSEGQPISILEALRSSLFVIATNVGCNSSMVNKNNGLLVLPNKESIVDAFSLVITNWEQFKDKRQNSLNLFNEHFTEEKMFNSYLQIFDSL
jgi:glycosyltransferase involved in cell wall biosynthesis